MSPRMEMVICPNCNGLPMDGCGGCGTVGRVPRPVALRIGLVSCSGPKLAHPAPARELYTSPLFRLSLDHALSTCDRVFILSAKHGLVDLNAVIWPYQHKLQRHERIQWGSGICSAIRQRYPGERPCLVIYAGADYADAILGSIPRGDDRGWTFERPLHGMQIGERLQWLKRTNAEVQQ